MKEFQLINYIKKNLKFFSSKVIRGIGDDCAIVKYDNKTSLLITSDSLFEDVHFSKKYFLPEEIGEKAARVNISDIAAMGGIPFAALLNIGFNKREKFFYIKKIIKGIIKSFKKYKIQLIGGDTISADKIFISITVIGLVNNKFILQRNGAKPGDIIFTTGNLGESYAGLKLLTKRKRKNISLYEKKLIKKHLTPFIKLKESQILAKSGFLTSCMDISDGLISDITRIAEESKVGAEIYVEKLPVSNEIKKVSQYFNENFFDYALYGGEDYELLFTVSEKNKYKFFNFAQKSKIKVFEIGKIIKDRCIYKIIDGNKIKERYGKVWKHF